MLKKKSKVINLGCRLNFFESEIIKNILEKEKIEKQIVINTCAVTNQAVRKSIYEVKKASKENPDYKIFVTGCASQIDKSAFQELENVSHIVDNKEKTQPESYLGKKIRNNDTFNIPFLENFLSNRTRAMLQVQQGCDHRCTFCIIPFGRGDSKSLAFDEISKRVGKIINDGFSEIILTGVDLTSYGQDLPGKPRLGNILKRLFQIHTRLKRLRLSSIDPAEIDNDLFELLVSEKRILPHLHLSLQSGDNLILKRMKRRHTREKVIHICKEIKSIRPEFTFGADVIVGFPTEEEKQFQNTTQLIKHCGFSNVHIFPYSPKKGTPASKMPQVDEKVKRERVKILRKQSKEVLFEQLNSKIGKSATILFESKKKSYTDNYYKVKMVGSRQETVKKPGSIIDVKVVARKGDLLLAEFQE